MVKVSVVIPVYNVEDFLSECLDSIINQTLKDIEIICVNDGSKDNSLAILNEYASNDNRFTIINQKNGGHAVATNRGIELAKGDFLFLMDSDDILDLNALEETVKIAEDKNVDFVLFQAINYYMDKNEYVEKENYSMNKLADFVGDKVFNWKDVKEFIFSISVTPWSKLYKRDFIVNSNIKFPEGLVYDDNIFFWDVLFNAEKITFYRKHLFTRRWYSSSSTRSGGKNVLDYIDINDLIWDTFKKYNVFEEFEEELFHKKVDTVYYWYNQISDDFREEYFIKMKHNYEKIYENNEFYEHFVDKLTDKSKIIFLSALTSNSYKEFDLTIENENYKKEIKKLHDEINQLKKLNKEYSSSTSWKITKPFRNLKKKI